MSNEDGCFQRLSTVLRPVRDFLYDHTPFLQRVIGESLPAHICAQLQEIHSLAGV